VNSRIRRWVPTILLGVIAGLLAVLFSSIVNGCNFPSEPILAGGKYTFNLEECNRQAKTLCESIACENDWRAMAGRMPRDLPLHCKVEKSLLKYKDAGSENEGGDQ